MERSAWTDERIDDMVAGVNSQFERIEARFDRLEARMDRFEQRLEDLHRQIFNFAIVQFVALLSILVTLIART
jgi:molecular chaperone GrpE (heat shock protein)